PARAAPAHHLHRRVGRHPARSRSGSAGSDTRRPGRDGQTLKQLPGGDATAWTHGLGSSASLPPIGTRVLDTALLRAGRFDRHILVDLPTLIEPDRSCFALYLGQYKLAAAAGQLQRLAALTPGGRAQTSSNVLQRGGADCRSPMPSRPRSGERTATARPGKALRCLDAGDAPAVVRFSIVEAPWCGAGLQPTKHRQVPGWNGHRCMLAGRAARRRSPSTRLGDCDVGMSDRIGHYASTRSRLVNSPVRPFFAPGPKPVRQRGPGSAGARLSAVASGGYTGSNLGPSGPVWPAPCSPRSELGPGAAAGVCWGTSPHPAAGAG
uniref:Transposase n=1 Tax=Macrostomum lignano TaxID=282301 RepID=A0A1I8FDB5_9PLAT